MVEMLNDKRVLERVKSYFDILKRTGYVKPGTTSRYLLYIFLYDFADVLEKYLTDEDYTLINRLLRNLFGDGNCLFPYHKSRGNAFLGMPEKDYTNDCSNG